MRAAFRSERLWAVLAVIAALSIVVRAPFIAVAPIARELSTGLGLDAGEVGLLTGLPVICFALCTPLASMLIGRLGANLATTIMLLGATLGIVLRSAGGTTALFAGTIVIGLSVTIGNIVIPVLIRRDLPPGRVALGTAFYTSAVNIGTLSATAITAPITELLGWRSALGLWAAVAALALLVWVGVAGLGGAFRPGLLEPALETGALEVIPGEEPASRPRRRSGGREHRDLRLLGLLLTIGFAGQAFSYYGVTAWLPSLLEDVLGIDRTAAGSVAGLFQLLGIAGAFGVPLLLRLLGARSTATIVGLLWVVVPLGLLLAPEAWLAWSLLGGFAQGGGFTLIFFIVIEIARSDDHARRMTASVQTIGYVFAALAAPLVGAVHDASGGWTASLLVLVGSTLAYAGGAIGSAVLAHRGSGGRPAAAAG